MNYIFCPSYASLFFALDLKNSGKDIKIITDNISVRNYCRTANLNGIYYEYVTVPITRLYKIATLRSRIDNLIKKVDIKKEDDFYLLDNSFDISCFYLAKEWSKRGEVYFNNLQGLYTNQIKDNYLNFGFLILTSSKYLFKLFLGLDLIFLEVNSAPVFGISDKFLKENNIKKFTLTKNLKELKLDAMRKSHIKLIESDNLIISDGNISGRVTEASLLKMYKSLLKLPYKFAVKYHPHVLKRQKLARYEELFISCGEFPDYIPVELLFNNIRRSVIAIYSAALIAASQLGHLKAISLLELVEWNNPTYKREIKNWLIKESNDRIIFVNNFEELSKLLEG